MVEGGLHEGGGFSIYFFIFEKGSGLHKILSKYNNGGGLQAGGGLQERIRYEFLLGRVRYTNLVQVRRNRE